MNTTNEPLTAADYHRAQVAVYAAIDHLQSCLLDVLDLPAAARPRESRCLDPLEESPARGWEYLQSQCHGVQWALDVLVMAIDSVVFEHGRLEAESQAQAARLWEAAGEPEEGGDGDDEPEPACVVDG